MIIFVFISLIYFLSRLINLTALPIFTDEAIYLHWSEMMWHDATQRFIPLIDGKPPLFMWLTIPFLKNFPDPLFAGRFLSVICGFFALLGFYFLAKELFNKKIGIISSFLYLLSPFSLTYDRMALVETMLLTWQVWLIYFLIKLVKEKRLDWAMLAGGFLGLSLLTKPTALLFASFFPVSLIFFKKNKNWRKNLLKIAGLWLVAIIIAFFLFYIQNLSPFLRFYFSRSRDYVFSLEEIIRNPFWQTFHNLKGILGWLSHNLTWPIFYGSLISLAYGASKKSKSIIFLLLLLLLLLLPQAIMSKVMYPRYFLILLPMFLISLAYGLNHLLIYLFEINLKFVYLFICLFLIPSLVFDYYLIFNPQKTSFASVDHWQYLSSWSSGQGIKEVSDYLKNQDKNKKILVAAEGNFGNPLNGLQIYLENYSNIEIIPIGQPVFNVAGELKKKAEGKDIYLVVNKSRMAFWDNQLELISEYLKPQASDGSQDGLLFFQVKN